MHREIRYFRAAIRAWWLLPTLLLAGCAVVPGFEDIDVTRAGELLEANRENPDFAVIDVRSPREFAVGRIPGAVNISIHDPNFRRNLEGLNREKTYLVYCNVGTRSRRVGGLMGEMEFKRIYHLPAGIRGWQAGERPVER